jgi:hypothetical protein
MPPPVRIKVYGLISLTRRGYLTCVGVGVVGLLALLIWWAVSVDPPMPADKAVPALLNPATWSRTGVWRFWRHWGPWLIVGGLLLGAIEAFFVLRRFRRAEAEQQQAPPPDATPKGN